MVLRCGRKFPHQDFILLVDKNVALHLRQEIEQSVSDTVAGLPDRYIEALDPPADDEALLARIDETDAKGGSNEGVVRWVLLFSLASESEIDEVLGLIWPYRVDGAIIAARLKDDQIRQFNDRGIPIILYNRVGEAEPAASVACDSAAGTRELIKGLLAAGHQRFGALELCRSFARTHWRRRC